MGVEQLPGRTEAGKRIYKRARVLLAAKLRTAGGEIDVRLRDLSRKGALVEASERLATGDEVVFVRGQTVVPARIAWTGGQRMGLEFLRLIDESEVLVHVKRAPAAGTATKQAERFRRPRILSEDMSDQDRRLAQVWAVSVGISVGE